MDAKSFRWAAVGAAIVISAAVAGVATRGARSPQSLSEATSGNDDRIDYLSAEELVEASEMVVVGRVVSEVDQSFDFRSAATGAVAATLTEHVATVEVSRVLKGSTSPGQRIGVVQTANSSRSGRSGLQEDRFEVLPFDHSRQYVFFLVSATMPPDYKGAISTWGRPGEPGFAELSGNGDLRFIFTQRYADHVAQAGRDTSNGGPIVVSLSELEVLAAD